MPTFAQGTLLLAVSLIGCRAPADNTDISRSGTDKAIDAGGATAASAESAIPVVLLFGDSITAGLGVGTEVAYPARLKAKADSAGLKLRFVTAGNSGETSAGGLRRIDWFLDDRVDLLLLELGANDGLRGVPVEDIRRNLQGIIDTVRARNPDVVVAIAGMQIPPNMGADYADDFRQLFPELASRNDAVLIPFLLVGVAGDAELNQSDRIHPNVRGHAIVAETVWEVLREPLTELVAQ